MEEDVIATMIVSLGMVVIFILFAIIGFVIVSVNERKISNTYNEVQRDDISQEEIHAHDFTSVNQDDISQQEIHEHQPWNDEGPIKYN